MPKIALISCTSKKHNKKTKAKDLYTSPLFKGSKNYAEVCADNYYILSAKHGILRPDEKIKPYNESLYVMPKKNRSKWASNVTKELISILDSNDKVIFLAGKKYREFLNSNLLQLGYETATPLEGFPIGKQLQWYSTFINSQARINDLNQFYRLIKKLDSGLNGGMNFQDANGKFDWPTKGVYFIFEPDEFRKIDPFQNRVIRVGTHCISKGSSSTLWNRLRTHKGTLKLTGNHRSSVFRLHVGKSIIRKNCLHLPSWGEGQIAPNDIKKLEYGLEIEVFKLYL